MLGTIGKYKIKRELGKGAMGIVFEGVDPFIERAVAIKVIKKSDLDGVNEQDILARFLREAQAAGRLTHSNIVSVYEYGEDGDTAFIAMEFVQGADLKKYFDDEYRFSIEESINIICQLLEALDYSHRNGVIHRDIKPSNVIITNTKQVKVADFGIAKLESSQLTQVGTMLGTPAYMSPEQIQDFATDNRSDLYAAGVIFYELLTGMRPFSGSPITIMHQVVHVEPKYPHNLNPAIPAVLDEIVAKAMAKKPEDRYQTARDFINALVSAQQSGRLVEEFDADATNITSRPVKFENKEIPALESELSLWQRIKDSKSEADFLYYIKHYPNGLNVEPAKLQLAKLSGAIYPKDGMTAFYTATATALRAESPIVEPEQIKGAGGASALSKSPTKTLIIAFCLLAVLLLGLVTVFFIKLSNAREQEALAHQMALEKAEMERVAKAEEQKIAAQKAEEERLAAQIAEEEKIAAQQLAEEKAERERLEQEKLSTEKSAAKKLAAERAAAAKKAADEKAAADKAKEIERDAQAAAERAIAAEKAAADDKKKAKAASSAACQFFCGGKK